MASDLEHLPSVKQPLPANVTKALKVNSNWVFIRNLYRLEDSEKKSKSDRVKVLNGGTKGQRMLVIHLLHQCMKGVIKISKADHDLLKKSGKIDYLDRHFQDEIDVRRLLKASDAHQKSVLAGVSNFHLLFRTMLRK
jgi:hypothetical protein